jgi:hypothetical protein
MHSHRVVLVGVVLASAASWVATVAFMHLTAQPGGTTAPMAAVVAATTFVVIVTASVMLARCRGTSEIPLLPSDDDSPRAPQRTINVAVMRLCLYLLLGVILCFLLFVSGLISSSDSIEAPFAVGRFVGGGIVSPAAAILCLFGAMLTGMLAGLRRLSLVGNGYTALAHRSPAFRLLSGAPRHAPGSALSTKPTEMDNENRDLQHFVSVLDLPMQNMSPQCVICVVAFVATAAWSVGRISTIDGVSFSMFLTCASWWVLLTALLLLVQGGVTWRTLRPKLARISQTRLAKPLGKVGRIVQWDLSIAPPRLCELMPLAQRAERIRGSVFLVASRLGAMLDDPQPVDQLRREINERKSSPLLASAGWHTLWLMSNRIVGLLESEHWSRRGDAEQQAIVASVQPDASAHQPQPAGRPTALALWFGQCEEFVALQFVFVLRDVLARIMSSLFAAMVCLTLLTAAHLFYLFQGRASMLTADLIALTVTAVVAIRIVVGIERDAILSKLRHTTPGRINFSWDFVRQVATYGLLPLIAVIASLFPEVGGSLFSWLEPLRKLAAP